MLILSQKLQLKNFKSILSAEFDFSKYSSGLHFIRGINKTKIRPDSNGAGKSSFFDALYWCLTGKDTNGLIAGNIGNWSVGKDCSVLYDTDKFSLFRSWKPNDLVLTQSGESRKVENEEVEQLINFSANALLYSIITGQFSSQFLDLDPADKLDIFSSVLNLNIWEKYSANARLLFDSLESDVVELERKINNVEYALRESEKEDYEKSIVEYEERRKGQIKEVTGQIEAIKEKLGDITKVSHISLDKIEMEREACQKLEEKLENKRISVKKLRDKLHDETRVKKNEANMNLVGTLNEESAGVEAVLHTYENEIWKLGEKSNDLQRDIKNYRNLEIGSKCSRCGNIIEGDHIEQEIAEIENEIKKLSEKEKEFSQEKEKHQKELDNLQKKKEELGKKIGAYLKEVDLLSRDFIDGKNEIVQIENDIKHSKRSIKLREEQAEAEKKSVVEYEGLILNYRKEIEGIRNRENPYVKMKEEAEKKQRGYRKEIRVLKDELKEASTPQIIAKEWIKGFRDVRFMVVEEALEELQLITNNNIERLGLEDWVIKYLVDRETKKKTIKKGFEVYVLSPYNKELVPIKAFSGGERGRLRLGSTFGLSDFLVDRRGTDFDVRFYDEPTQWLSPEGIDDLLNFLKEEADSKNRKIFIVDQNELESGYFDTITTIIKDGERGSYVG